MVRFIRSPVGLAILTVVLVGATAILATQLPNVIIDNDVRNLAPHEHETIKFCDEADELFGSSNAIVAVLKSPDGITAPLLQLTRDISDELERLYEGDVRSVTNSDTIIVEGTTLKPKELVAKGPLTASTVAKLHAYLDDWPIFEGMLVSEDRKSVAILLTMPFHAELEHRAQRLANLRSVVGEHVEKSGLNVESLIAGEPVIALTIGDGVAKDLGTLSPLALLVVLLVLILSLRSPGGVAGPVITVVMAVVATFGLMALAERPVMVVTSSIPVFLIAVGSAYGIHVASHFRRLFLGGKSRTEAVAGTLKEVGGAVFAAAITTVAGFASLSINDIPPLQDFGIFLASGVAVALLASLTLVPLVLLIGPRYARTASKTDADDPGWLGRYTMAVAGWSTRHPKPVVLVTAVLLVLLGGSACAWLKVDQDSVKLFRKDSSVASSEKFLSANFGGTHTFQAVVIGPEERSMLEPAVLQFMVGLQDHVAGFEKVGKTTSLADSIQRMNLVMHKGDREYNTIPDSRQLVAQYIQLYELSGDTEDFEALVDFNYTRGQVLVQMRTTSASDARDVRDAMTAFARDNLPDGYSLKMAGVLTRYDVVNRFIVEGQLWSLGLSLLMVFVIAGFLFFMRRVRPVPGTTRLGRGISNGALTLVPIIMAVVANFGLMAIFNIRLEIGTAIIAACAIGIGIDYSVHFLHRYGLGIHRGLTPYEAVTTAAATAGKPIVYNATAVSAGFLTLLLSDFVPLATMGWLTALTMLVASTGALTVLPALVALRDSRTSRDR
jgi:uncharacterized protein